jgi:hypothetical protein
MKRARAVLSRTSCLNVFWKWQSQQRHKTGRRRRRTTSHCIYSTDTITTQKNAGDRYSWPSIMWNNNLEHISCSTKWKIVEQWENTEFFQHINEEKAELCVLVAVWHSKLRVSANPTRRKIAKQIHKIQRDSRLYSNASFDKVFVNYGKE